MRISDWSSDVCSSDLVIEMAGARHRIEFQPGTRILKRATVTVIDVHGRTWIQELEAAAPPWVIQTMGYTPGSWKDGGSFHCYHGSETLATEWDERSEEHTSELQSLIRIS